MKGSGGNEMCILDERLGEAFMFDALRKTPEAVSASGLLLLFSRVFESAIECCMIDRLAIDIYFHHIGHDWRHDL